MSENCTHDCSSCGETCSEREQEQNSFRVDLGAHSSVKKGNRYCQRKNGGVGKISRHFTFSCKHEEKRDTMLQFGR